MRGAIVFELLSWWHAGTGRGDGPAADAVVVRAGGLPYIPGRTVKGLARDAARLGVAAGLATGAQVETWFGSDLVRGTPENRERRLEEARFRTTPGALGFGSAVLGPAWARWAAEHPVEREFLLSKAAATRIDASGVAQDETLRVVEIAAPMTLRAPVEGLDPVSAEVLGPCLELFVRGLGSHRNRGLGRVRARLELEAAP